ncbi:MAG: bifunctional DNA primase/polymerase [Phycisphaerae bacterium]
MDLRDSAVWYAALGWHVIPLHSIRDGVCTCGKTKCDSPGKHPHTKNGLKDASNDPVVIERCWRQWPDANVGICTGARSGIVALDIDPRHGGDESLEALIDEQGELPSTVEAISGSGGQHLIFTHPGGTIRNRTSLLVGIDVRGDGGYIVGPPSIHISGAQYRWRDGHGPHEIKPAAIPPPLLELMTAVHLTRG